MLLPLAGFVAGMHHVVTGPDHLAAVAPLAVSDRRAAWRGGMTWALGHAGGVSIIALIALALREVIPFEAEWLSGWSERLVGAVLVAIGLWGLKRAFSHRLHTHVHEHDGQRHVHVHVHEESGAHHPREATAHHHHSHAALAVGTLHGLAGGSHFLGVIPALVAPGPSDAVLYLACYALGTVTSMVAFASILGFLAHRAGESGMRWARGLMTLSSAAAIVVGAFWLATSFRGPV
ncbi:MAG: sulfite exporter TauE/SafE family protein [Verrucomicrobiales bacterium]|nr:sulfite exporter TauE/SafE family protein [Verrucomicrobiales bacterium]